MDKETVKQLKSFSKGGGEAQEGVSIIGKIRKEIVGLVALPEINQAIAANAKQRKAIEKFTQANTAMLAEKARKEREEKEKEFADKLNKDAKLAKELGKSATSDFKKAKQGAAS